METNVLMSIYKFSSVFISVYIFELQVVSKKVELETFFRLDQIVIRKF